MINSVEKRLSHDMQALLPGPLVRLLETEQVLRKSYVVGGFVRDALLGRPSKDVDLEVYGVDYGELAAGLGRHGRVDLVGKSFGVIKLTLPGCETIDFAIPRKDSKTAPGHQGFEMDLLPELSLHEATRRRDFTINALLYDPRERQVIDWHGGLLDLEERRLRVVDRATFTDDPLRVLRAMQFLARFCLEPDPELIDLASSMKGTFAELAKERVCDEWLKWAAQSREPSRGLEFLRVSGWLTHFVELEQMRGVPQDPEWHPEGDVWSHTKHCCDAMADLAEWQALGKEDRLVFMLAILLHDIGKASTTSEVEKNGRLRIVSPGHEAVSAREAKGFLEKLGCAKVIQNRVVPLVANHMIHLKDPTDRAVRRLAHRLAPETIRGLCLVMKADSQGRPPKPKAVPETVTALLKRSEELVLAQGAPKPLLQGRDLLPLGFRPGPGLGEVLKQAFEAQLDGEFRDREGALNWLRQARPESSA